MTNQREPRSPQMFEALAALHLGSGVDTGLSPGSRAQSWMHSTMLGEYLAFSELQRVKVRTLTLLASAPASHSMDLRSRLESELSCGLEAARNAVAHLDHIVTELGRTGSSVIVMKTLDHWPDIGSDLDLFTTASANDVQRAMTREIGAELLAQSWGDRLASKWNFRVPGLPQLVEVHVKCLGQTGEQKTVPKRLLERCIRQEYRGYAFYVPAPEQRVVLATLQRMYRHFYVRLTDILNITRLVKEARLDFDEVRKTAELGALWPGVATFLHIVSDYNAQYAGTPLDLPTEVLAGARFGKEATCLADPFLRIPIVPEAAGLYARQWWTTGMERRFNALGRLSLLPFLAVAAFMSLRVTGDDKGVW